ncbi:uncharacterized protein LOC132271516 [Cornus florida]|uniref:uncharacterized protein LOC132271516 n=1 Tax=Cornus florida TaxID=4283 RepID=UPI00289EAB47|nr:uncharacterized protein LOC132271516 [Cornus florida]
MSRSARILLIFAAVVGLCFFPPTARSQPLLRLPGDDGSGEINGEDLCSGTASPPSCPVNCFKTDPVCGADGVTYWCGCGDAVCAGTRVAKLGFCDVGNGTSDVSGQALLLVHMLWLILLGFSVLFGLL